jgi:glycosyltransferase involved in cell wall biosynthesis
MVRSNRKVSIGLPVFNGENYLEQALDSLLAQTYSDFEIVICDNASTDSTPDICQAYAARDRRIRYHRNEIGIGVDRNFNRVFELATGEYFKWAAHDDICEPSFIERCVEVLDRDPSVTLCYPRTRVIDQDGNPISDDTTVVDAASSKPHVRFYHMIHIDHWCFQIYGLIRSSALKQTLLHESYSGSDRVLLAELSLHGRLQEIPEYLFLRRDHPLTSARISEGAAEKLVAYDPQHERQTQWLGLRRFQGYWSAVSRAPLSRITKALCYLQLVRLAAEKSVNRVREGHIHLPFRTWGVHSSTAS